MPTRKEEPMPGMTAGWLDEHPASAKAQAIADDFTNLVRVFGEDAVQTWLRRYARARDWQLGDLQDDGTAGELRVTVRGMHAVLEGVAGGLGFGPPDDDEGGAS